MSLILQLPYLALVAVGVLLVHRILLAAFRHRDVWAKLDTVGLPSWGLFKWTRAVTGSITSLKKNTHDGYKKFSKGLDRPFALPNMWTGGAVVVLPPSMLHLLNRPRDELSSFGALLETIQLPYMISDRDVYMNVIHFDVVRKNLTKKDVGALASVTAEEVDVAFRECWGTHEQWMAMNGWDACGRVIARTALRILIGLPLCRNDDLLEQSRMYADSVFAGTVIINCLPPFMRPVIGPLVAIRAKYYQARCLKILVPFIEKRIQQWTEDKHGDNLPVCAKTSTSFLACFHWSCF
jgi:hypothetical protein